MNFTTIWRHCTNPATTVATLRPSLEQTDKPALTYKQTYIRVLQAVRHHKGLIHGRLRNTKGECCAVGAYFQESDKPINTLAISEIATYNDSFKRLSMVQRRKYVIEWLTKRVKELYRSGDTHV